MLYLEVNKLLKRVFDFILIVIWHDLHNIMASLDICSWLYIVGKGFGNLFITWSYVGGMNYSFWIVILLWLGSESDHYNRFNGLQFITNCNLVSGPCNDYG